jgi:hypothetical protein
MAADVQKPTDPVSECGPWRAGVDPGEGQWRVFVESGDFTHDARLYVTGDFRDEAQQLAYAQEIAWRLNAWKA